MQWFLIAVGGALGALARHGAGLLAIRTWGTGLPIGTWAVNLIGSFLIGLVVPAVMARAGAMEGLRLAFVIGFIGSFTTFSTYSLDTFLLWESGRPGWALLNAAGSMVLGLALVALGLWLGRHWA